MDIRAYSTRSIIAAKLNTNSILKEKAMKQITFLLVAVAAASRRRRHHSARPSTRR